jgi:hypothetical protein
VRKGSKPLRVAGWFLAIVLAVPALWVLSAGPVAGAWVKFDLKNHPLEGAFTEIYRPLGPLADSKTYAGKLFRAYLRAWGVPALEPGELVAPVGG